MAKWGDANFDDLLKLKERLDALRKVGLEEFISKVARELAARLLAEVIPRTPVGKYPTETGKKGGTLRRGWTGGVDKAISSYAASLPIEKQGSEYIITIENPVEYGIYVEYGHRQTPGRFVPAIGKRLVVSFVPGQFMLRKSETYIDSFKDKLIEKRLVELLKEVF